MADKTDGADPRTAELETVRSELAKYNGRDNLSAEEVKEGNELLDRAERLQEEIASERAFEQRRIAAQEKLSGLMAERPTAVERADDIDAEAVERSTDVKRGRNPWDLDHLFRNLHDTDEIMSRALSAAEFTPGIDDKRREALTRVIERGEGEVPQMALVTTSPAYKRAFGKLMRSGGNPNFADFTPEEQLAISAAEPLRRAMSASTNNAGGFLVPTDIEPAVTLSSAGTNNPIYNAARRVQTTGTTYRVVTAPHAAWSWDGENTEVSDDTPTFANTDITLYYAQGFVPMSIASQQSIQGAVGIASDVLQGGWNDLVGAALTTGTGSSQPVGIVTALTGGGSEVSSASTDAFAVADVYSTFEPLPARHRRNAIWMSSIEALGDIRNFGTADSHALLTRLGDGEQGLRILGRPWVENEDMDSTVTALSENYYLLIGDFSHFVVAEGIGTLAEVLPHVFGTNGRPIGARGLYMATRFGSDCVLDDAFRMLNVT